MEERGCFCLDAAARSALLLVFKRAERWLGGA
jgi:hypothetical protein